MTKSHTTSFNAGPAFTRSGMIWLVLVVVLLAGVTLPLVHLKTTHEREAATESEMELLARACLRYFRDTHELPQRPRDLVLRPGGAAGECWAGPYVESAAARPGAIADSLLDAWGRPYEVIPGTDSALSIYSAGADQDDLEDDLVRWFTVRPQREEATRERLGILNAAIDRFLRVHPERPFSAGAAALIATLRAEHFLDEDASLDHDGWGQDWVADPRDQSPIRRLTSRNLRPAPPVHGR